IFNFQSIVLCAPKMKKDIIGKVELVLYMEKWND
ncbi:MAG: hypothetical protein K0R18_2504, partial [Bacillales bacterium]|nr:hypothetical protein [Bacillales bacterium]